MNLDVKAASADIIFVSMPFGSIRLPSIGLSLLQASLRENAIGSTIEYPALEFAATIGVENYERIAGSAPELLIGEWIFSKAAFGYREEPALFKTYLARSTYGVGFIDDWERLVACQDTAVTFVESWARRIVLAGPKLVGITSTFQQNVPSIALARHIKAVAPESSFCSEEPIAKRSWALSCCDLAHGLMAWSRVKQTSS